MLFLFLLFCVACPREQHQTQKTYSTTPSSVPSVYPEPGAFGGERQMGNTALPNSFNPYLASDAASLSVIYQMFTGLTAYDALQQKLVPALAERWEHNAEGTRYVFTLRPDLHWSDGHPLTAQDVVFTYNQVINNPLIPNNYRDFWAYQQRFPRVEALNDLQVSFTLDKPFAPLLFNVMAPILPAHLLAQDVVPDEQGKLPFFYRWNLDVKPEKLVVNGPWRLQYYRPGERVVLEKNPHFYLKNAEGRRLPYLDRLVLMDVQSHQAALLRFRQGELDTYIMNPADYDLLAEEQEERQFTIYNLGPSPSSLFVMLNQSLAKDEQGKPLVDPVKSKWFRDLNFRKALAWSMDKSGMIDSIYKGRATPQYVHLNQHNPFFHTGLTDYPYDVEAARQLLRQSGFYWNEKQELFDAEGHRVRFELTTNSANIERDATCSLLRRQWRKLGIEVDYKPVTFSVLVQKMHDSHRWEAMMVGLASNSLEPHFSSSRWRLDGRMHLFNMGNTKRFGTRATQYAGWERQMESLYQEASETLDPERRKDLYWRAQELEYANLPYLYTVSETSLVAVSDRLGNIRPSIYGGSGLHQVNWNSPYHYLRSAEN